jgi:hypothetical protein
MPIGPKASDPDSFDTLSALDASVEQGTAPGQFLIRNGAVTPPPPSGQGTSHSLARSVWGLGGSQIPEDTEAER